MSKYDLIKDVKGGGFNLSDLIPLTSIKTESDLTEYHSKNIGIPFCLEDFNKAFKNVNPEYIYFKPSLFIVETVYLSLDKYIYKQIPIYNRSCEVMSLNDKLSKDEALMQYVNIMIKAYEKKDYTTLLYSAPDSLRFELFFKMIDDDFIEKEEIYDVFISLYTSCEFGFGKFNNDMAKKIFSHQSLETKNKLKEKLSDFHDEILIYRGEGDDSTSYVDGSMSWTLDKNIANFFANRYANKYSKILTAKVKKENIIEYYNGRNEKEVLVFPENINLIDTTEFWGLDKFEEPWLFDRYKYSLFREILRNLSFKNISGHDKEHSLRVLFLSLIIAMELELNDDEVELLSLASINHDRGRLHDKECTEHGRNSYKIFEKENQLEDLEDTLEFSHNEEHLEFLMTYHCKEDIDAQKYLSDSSYTEETKELLLKLLYILKDADALDRVRFGIRALDMSYLRYDISKKLTLIARLTLENLKL